MPALVNFFDFLTSSLLGLLRVHCSALTSLMLCKICFGDRQIQNASTGEVF